MANDYLMTYTLQNGTPHDADEVQQNLNDLNKKIYISATAPTSPHEGQIWYDKIGKTWFGWDGNSWQPLNA